MPGSGSGASGDMAQTAAMDPFTGANSYRPSASSTGTAFGADPFTGTAYPSSKASWYHAVGVITVTIMCTLYACVNAHPYLYRNL